MKEIKLTKGKVAFVDDEDFELMNMVRWQAKKNGNSWYAMREVRVPGDYKKKKNFQMHRILLGVEDPNQGIDHKDGNGLNNQRNNLRLATKAQNAANIPPRLGFTSQYKGVYKSTGRNMWTASIKKNGVLIHLGQFKNEKDAAMAYNRKSIELNGEFANLSSI